MSSVGTKIQQLRKAKNLSVEQLANLCKTDRSFIEELESDQLVPSVAPLLKIARGLGVSLSTFLDDNPTGGAVVSRAGQQPQTALQFSGLGPYCVSTLEFHPLARNKKDRRMEPFIIDISASVPEENTFSVHDGEEFIYVLKGEIEVFHGDERYVLGAGDSIYYESSTSHQVKAAGDKDAQILAVIFA